MFQHRQRGRLVHLSRKGLECPAEDIIMNGTPSQMLTKMTTI